MIQGGNNPGDEPLPDGAARLADCSAGASASERRRTMGKRRNGESVTSIVGGAMRTGRYGLG